MLIVLALVFLTSISVRAGILTQNLHIFDVHLVRAGPLQVSVKVNFICQLGWANVPRYVVKHY
jgi:hypothetical protein